MSARPDEFTHWAFLTHLPLLNNTAGGRIREDGKISLLGALYTPATLQITVMDLT